MHIHALAGERETPCCSTYAAVAANTSALRALVRSPTLMANRLVNPQISIILLILDSTNASASTAPTSSTAANKILIQVTNISTLLSEEYPTFPSDDLF